VLLAALAADQNELADVARESAHDGAGTPLSFFHYWRERLPIARLGSKSDERLHARRFFKIAIEDITCDLLSSMSRDRDIISSGRASSITPQRCFSFYIGVAEEKEKEQRGGVNYDSELRFNRLSHFSG